MQHADEDDKTIYKVVINDEEQYSIWPEHRENPLGWRDVGKVGPKAECLAHVKEVWTDMRPLSLRKKMEELARNPPAPEPSPVKASEGPSLVDQLCVGDHPLTICLHPGPSSKRLQAAINDGYVRVKFTDTEGGTELGVHLDKEMCDFKEANFEDGTGQARIVGNLNLDYTKLRCMADIDLNTLEGRGHLEKVKAAVA